MRCPVCNGLITAETQGKRDMPGAWAYAVVDTWLERQTCPCGYSDTEWTVKSNNVYDAMPCEVTYG